VGFDTEVVPLETTADAAFTCNPQEEIDAPFGSCNWADTEMTSALTFFRATEVEEMMAIAKATQASVSSLNPA